MMTKWFKKSAGDIGFLRIDTPLDCVIVFLIYS